MGSIRLKVLGNWTAGLTGWLYLRGSCAPADYACPDAAGAEPSTLLPNLVALSDQYRTTHDARPWSPTQLATHPFHYRTLRIPPVPQRASQGLGQGVTVRRDHNVPHVLLAFLCCPARQSPRLRPFGRVSFRWVGERASQRLISASNDFEAQLQLALSLFATHCSTAALGGDTKQCCVVRCRQLPNQAPRSISTISPF